MSTSSHVVRPLSDSDLASSSLRSISSFRDAVEGSSSSRFTVTDTRKCSKTCSTVEFSKRRDSELPLPPMKPSRPASRIQAVYDWEASQPTTSNQAEGAEPNATAPIEICYQEEATIDGRSPFGLSATQNSMTSSQLLLRGFRQDLDEEVQTRIIKEHRKERHAAWAKLHPATNSKCSEVNKWPKRQQAMGLALLVVEASIHMRKLRAVHRTPVTTPVCTPAQPPRASQTSTLDITDARIVAMILHDVFMLVDNTEENKYEDVCSELHALRLWTLR